jgi:hypothetical protein
MRRFAAVLVAPVAVVGAGAGRAATPIQLEHVDVSNSFTIEGPCPFDVTDTTSGPADVTLWTNASGQVVREHDTTPGSTITYSANGKSFSFPGALGVDTDYGSGALLGGAATARLTGLFGHVPGVIASDAGQQIVVDATVVGFDPVRGAEIPVVDGGEVVIQHGNSNSDEAVAEAICSALS